MATLSKKLNVWHSDREFLEWLTGQYAFTQVQEDDLLDMKKSSFRLKKR